MSRLRCSCGSGRSTLTMRTSIERNESEVVKCDVITRNALTYSTIQGYSTVDDLNQSRNLLVISFVLCLRPLPGKTHLTMQIPHPISVHLAEELDFLVISPTLSESIPLELSRLHPMWHRVKIFPRTRRMTTATATLPIWLTPNPSIVLLPKRTNLMKIVETDGIPKLWGNVV